MTCCFVLVPRNGFFTDYNRENRVVYLLYVNEEDWKESSGTPDRLKLVFKDKKTSEKMKRLFCPHLEPQELGIVPNMYALRVLPRSMWIDSILLSLLSHAISHLLISFWFNGRCFDIFSLKSFIHCSSYCSSGWFSSIKWYSNYPNNRSDSVLTKLDTLIGSPSNDFIVHLYISKVWTCLLHIIPHLYPSILIKDILIKVKMFLLYILFKGIFSILVSPDFMIALTSNPLIEHKYKTFFCYAKTFSSFCSKTVLPEKKKNVFVDYSRTKSYSADWEPVPVSVSNINFWYASSIIKFNVYTGIPFVPARTWTTASVSSTYLDIDYFYKKFLSGFRRLFTPGITHFGFHVLSWSSE